jgi:hypothetical protein
VILSGRRSLAPGRRCPPAGSWWDFRSDVMAGRKLIIGSGVGHAAVS